MVISALDKGTDDSFGNVTGYLAPCGFESLLLKELKDVSGVHQRLVLAKGPPQQAYWAQNVWYNPSIITIRSISHAAKCLRAIQRNWWPYGVGHHRRMHLIQEQLPFIAPKPVEFLGKIPSSPLGSWTLIDDYTMLFSSHCLSPVPNGEWIFNEDKINPPSRAYLKLWELFSRFKVFPTKRDTCLELGASPGGWTWVLSKLAKKVIAYDRASLHDNVMGLKNVSFHVGDAFKVDLSAHQDASWVFSDLVCFPDKLYRFIEILINNFPNKNYVFTVKFKGDEHGDVMAQFAKLPGTIVHLSHNKHELMWFKINQISEENTF